MKYPTSNYKVQVSEMAKKRSFLLETDVYEILALQNILLIKHTQESDLQLECFGKDIMNKISEETKDKINVKRQMLFNRSIKKRMEEIIDVNSLFLFTKKLHVLNQ